MVDIFDMNASLDNIDNKIITFGIKITFKVHM